MRIPEAPATIEADAWGRWVPCFVHNGTLYCIAGPVSPNVELRITGRELDERKAARNQCRQAGHVGPITMTQVEVVEYER